MDCAELIDLFNKVGGILTCDYNKNIVTVTNTNLKCNIKPKDYDKLTELAHDFAFSPYQLEHLENKSISNDELVKSNIKLVNPYLKNNEYGFQIRFLSN